MTDHYKFIYVDMCADAQKVWSYDIWNSFYVQKSKEMIIFRVAYLFKPILEPKRFKMMEKVTILQITTADFGCRKKFTRAKVVPSDFVDTSSES